MKKKKVGTIELDPAVFAAPVKEHLLYYVVNWQRSRMRSGTASTKTRSQVSGGSTKPWRQKGTGRARAGTTRAPQWRKGGVAFGPKPKDWSIGLPKKVRKSALLGALTLKYTDGSLFVVKDFNYSEIKTKQVVDFIEAFDLARALIVIEQDNEILLKSARNLKRVKVIKSGGLNVYDLLRFDTLVMTEECVRKVQEVLAH
ncbi:MAG: 50S ribosomal protein L4 [Thermodesulfobacteriota bacterium]